MHSARPIRLSIKQGLWLLAAGMAAALALIWILDQHYQRRITEDTALQSMTVDLSRQLQNLRQQMDDFASSRQMQHADSFRQGFKRLEQQHQQLIQGLEQAGFPVADMEAAGQHFQQVKADFEAVVTKQVEIGLDRQMGHAGDLNAAAARVSQVVAPHPELAVSLLSLRQHEKDFLLYRDERFINQFMVALSTLRGKMFMSDLDNRVLAATQQSLRAYTDSFNTMAQLQREIGLNSGTGLTGKLNAAANQAEQRFTALAQQLNQHLQGRLNDARVQSTLSVITIMCLMLTSLGLVIRQLNRHFSHAQGQAQRLREGDLETPIEQIPGNEIGDLLLTLEGMRLGLVEKNEAMAKEHRTQTRLSELSSVLQGVKNTDALCEQVLRYLCNTFKAHIGTLYTYRDGELQCRASYGIADLEHRVHRIMAGEGIAGQCVVDRRQMTLRNLPADYLMISTGSLRTRPGTLLVTPLLWNEKVYGVVEIAASGPLPDEAAGFLQQASETIAIAVNTALVNADLAHTLRESQRQEERLRASEAALHSRQEAQQSMNEEQASHRRQPHYNLSHQ
ncbi:MAG: GAF domain-containing protein [Pseudomonadota bacterium]|nr:GAF domain-containing protein [Pseudomonadota bacterium]MEE3319113.1 GAF domain-containing protein [Pseudomonadota bacterium]